MKHVYGSEDIKGGDGQWLKSYYTFDEAGIKICIRTRSGFLWQDMMKRCSPKNWQTKYRSYEGCQNLFTSFNEFAEWCQVQHGYLSKDSSGRFWSLDKDIKTFGNRDYSAESCIFVPSWVNSFVTDNKKDRGDYPIGVSYKKNRGKFQASMTKDGKNVHLGSYNCPFDAHKAWQIAKLKYIEEICEKDVDVLAHCVLKSSLRNIASRLLSDNLNANLTECLTR